MSTEQFIPQEYTVSHAQQQSRAQRHQSNYEGDLFYDPNGSYSAASSIAPSQSPTPAYPSRHTPLTQPTHVHAVGHQEELESQHQAAIRQWGRRVKACFAIQLISLLCLLHSLYWYTTVIGVVLLIAILIFAYSIKQQQVNFVLVYVGVVLVNLIKNVVLLYFFFEEDKSGDSLSAYEYFLVILLLVDCIIFTPMSLYSCFFLHRSISLTSLTF